MKGIFDLIESFLGLALAKFIFALIVAMWASYLFTSKAHEIRDELIRQFAARDKAIAEVNMELDRLMANIKANMWSVHMMAERDRIVSEWNPTNRIPDPYRIKADVESGRPAVGVRIGP